MAPADDSSYGLKASLFGEPEQAASTARRLAVALIMTNEGPLYSDISLPIGGIHDGCLKGSTDKIEQIAYRPRLFLFKEIDAITSLRQPSSSDQHSYQ